MAIQLQEFAKQVLFGTTIEEKLSFPREEIIDTKPGSAFTTPRQLTRPAHLMLRDDGVRAKHPSQAKLVDETERGKLLHFFGNHELLATELMALAGRMEVDHYCPPAADHVRGGRRQRCACDACAAQRAIQRALSTLRSLEQGHRIQSELDRAMP